MANADSRKFGVRFEGVDNGLLLGLFDFLTSS